MSSENCFLSLFEVIEFKTLLKNFSAVSYLYKSPACLQSNHLLASAGRYPGVGVWSENLLEWSYSNINCLLFPFPVRA